MLARTDNCAHIGYALSRKYGPSVSRNLLRRRLRHVFAQLDLEKKLVPGLYLVVPYGVKTRSASYRQLEVDVGFLVGKIRSHLCHGQRLEI